MAKAIVCTAKSHNYNLGLSTLKSRWREDGKAAGFLYLLYVQKYELTPPLVRSEGFAKTLLKQATAIQDIREFSRAYQGLCKVLQAVGYDPPLIAAELGEPRSGDLSCPPFEPEIKEAI